MSDGISKPIIIVNATALEKSGALTILKQFVKYASEDIEHEYICFIPKNLNIKHGPNLVLVEISKMGWLKRIWWDSFGINSYLKKNEINPCKVVSLQNTSVNVKYQQIIYLHQPLPFSEIKFSLFKREQYKFILYKLFYKFFIFLFVNNKTIFVVQTSWMKDALCIKSNIDKNNVYVIQPDIVLPDISYNKIKTENPDNESYNLLYPATPIFYKNHKIILEAMKILEGKGRIDRLKFQVTFKAGEYQSFSEKITELGLTNHVDFLGTLPYEELIEKYQAASIVLFPSYLETFGLPLAEGASLKKPVLCSDLPFARDVLSTYPGAKYIAYQDPEAWAEAIENTIEGIANNSISYDDFEFGQSSSWEDFFELLGKI